MKTLYKFLLFFLLLSVTTFPQNRISETNNRNFKKLKTNLIQSERGNWKDTFREKQFYENNIHENRVIDKLLENGFLLIEEIYQRWEGSTWVNSGKDTYTYDENNNLTESVEQDWDGSAWVNYSKNSYTYDENNNLTERLMQWLNDSAWVNVHKEIYTYDENNNRTELLIHEWYPWAWEYVDAKVAYTYDENNNLTEWLMQWLNGGLWSNDSGWVNIWRNSYTYDENNNLTDELGQEWKDSAWVISWKSSYTYDENNNETEWFDQNWDDSVWVNYSKNSYTYDENNNETEWLDQHWDGSAWLNNLKYTYTHDENNNETEGLGQNWDGSSWVNYKKYSYKYLTVTKINEDLSLINSYSLSNNYPNPFNPSTIINYSIPRSSQVQIKLYDILGREVETLVNEVKSPGNYEVNFNASSLASGVYLYRLQAGSFVQTKKMMLLK